MAARGFHTKMLNYLSEYQEYLLLVKPKGTDTSRLTIIQEFINYLYNYHLVSEFDQITVSMANSKFYSFYVRQNDKVISKETMKKILKDYFVFLNGKYGIKNNRLMKGLERKIGKP